jgi:hypothetical protein
MKSKNKNMMTERKHECSSTIIIQPCVQKFEVKMDGTEMPDDVSAMIMKSADARIGTSHGLHHPSPGAASSEPIKNSPKQKHTAREWVCEGSPVTSRKDERYSIKEFINKRREILMLNLSIDAVQEEIDKLHEAYREKEKRVQRREHDLDENMRRFDCLLQDIYDKENETTTILDEQILIRKAKEIEVANLSKQVTRVESMLKNLATAFEDSSISPPSSC